MNGVLGHLCAHIGLTGPGEPPEDGEINEMTLPSRHRIRNSSMFSIYQLEQFYSVGPEFFD